MGGSLCRRRRGPGQSTPENAVLTQAESSLGFSLLSPQQVEYSLGKFSVGGSLSQAALQRAIRDLSLRSDQPATDLFFSYFKTSESAYDSKKLRLAGILMAKSDKNAKAVALWDVWNGVPKEEISKEELKALLTELVSLSLDCVFPLALTDPSFNGDRLKVWSKSQSHKHEKAVGHYLELLDPRGEEVISYQRFLQAVAAEPDDGITSMQQIRATIEHLRIMPAKFSSAFKGGFSASLISNKK